MRPLATRRLILLFILAAASLGAAPGCQGEPPASSDARPEEARTDRPDSGPALGPDTRAARADAAGLTLAQADSLVALGFPVYVPTMPPGWMLTGFMTYAGASGGLFGWPEYTLMYANRAGACVVVEAASEGLGDVFVQPPPRERTVALAGVSTAGPVQLGWAEPGDEAEGWEGGRVSSEWAGTDALVVLARSEEGPACTPATPDEVEAFLASLRPLDPEDDAAVIGPVAYVHPGDQNEHTDPEAAARAAFAPQEPGEGRQRTDVETLRQAARYAVVLVTTYDLADDSVRDLRTRAFLIRSPGGWSVFSAGRQQRCREGRGAQDWTTDSCF